MPGVLTRRCTRVVLVYILLSEARGESQATEEYAFLSFVQYRVAALVATPTRPAERRATPRATPAPPRTTARTWVRATVDTQGFSEEPGSLLVEAEGSERSERVVPLLRRIDGQTGNTTAADILAVKKNQEGDLRAFLSSLAFDSLTAIAFVSLFSVLRLRYPLVYSGNGQSEAHFPRKIQRGLLTWVRATLSNRVDEVQEHISLDAAMALEFHDLAAKLCALIGLPMCLFMGPLHIWCGNMPLGTVDTLSRFGMANIELGSWLYWVHSFVIWLVVVTVERAVFGAMERFLTHRYTWLKMMPAPRANTVLVENLPPGPGGQRSDAAVEAYFSRMFPKGQIKAVHVVRRTDELLQLVQRSKATEQLLRDAEVASEAGKYRPQHRVFGFGYVDSIDYYSDDLAETSERIRLAREQLAQADPADESVYTPCAFVTFEERQYAEIALRLQYRSDSDEIVMSIPPEPSDVRWGDLQVGPTQEAVMERVGYLCAIVLYIAFMPITVGISGITNMESLRRHFPVVDILLAKMPWMAAGIQGLLGSFALTLFLSFLPTFLMLIFQKFFVLRAEAWGQVKLQVWYFWFQVVFVLLVTIVGSSVIIAFRQIAEQPFAVFGIMADSMPEATHFYLNFMVMQWTTHAMNLTRYINLAKYLTMRPIVGEQRAKELSEPEDQDYYGFGSRSSRWTVQFAIALVFSQLSPLISLLGVIDFSLCRLVYGYLIVYAEDPKPDLGGVFFVQQLVHIQKCLFIYLALMIGVLFRRSASYGPVLVGVGALAHALLEYRRFGVRFHWQTLPFEEVVDSKCDPRRPFCRASYVQAELQDPPASGTL